MSLPPGFLDELRSRSSLSQVVGRKVIWDSRKSNQAKGDMWAPCPFHQEKSASFHVDDRKGFYYCFGCHAKGDAISFVRETENVGFMEAVEILAREAGMQTALDIDYRPNLWGVAGHGEGESRFVESERVTAKLQSTLHLFDLIVGTEEEFHIAGGTTDTVAALRAVL